jgi:hypothetical protein
MSSTDTNGDTRGIPQAVTDDLLRSRRRCRFVTALAAAGGEAIVADLVAALCAAEGAGGDCAAVEREIYERDLPKLTATGVVEYDSMLERVRLTESALAKQARGKL